LSKVENIEAVSLPIAHWGRLAANCTAHMTEHLFNAVVSVVLPLITASLGLSLSQAGALASIRTLMAGVASFPSGFFADLASRRNLLLGGCVTLIGLASLGLSASHSFSLLMVFMGLGGFGGGWFHPQSLAILSEKYRTQKAFALGVHDSSANLGEVVGPLAIGLMLNFFDWRTALLFWAIPGVVVGVVYALMGSEGTLPVRRAHEYRKSILNDVLKNKTVCGLVAVSTLRTMGQTALASFLPMYLLLYLKLPAAVAGAYMSILFLCAGIAPALVGWISDRIGHRYLIVLFSLLSVATVAAIPHLGSGIFLVCGLGLLGALLWALRPVIVSAAMSEAPQQLSGSVVALIYGANMGLSFMAPVVAGVVADRYGLPTAVTAIAVFPMLASLICFVLLVQRRS